jgi:hypothetical protein
MSARHAGMAGAHAPRGGAVGAVAPSGRVRGRAGAVGAGLAVGLLAILAAVAAAQLARTGQILDAATRDAGGVAAEEAAVAAVEEAAWRLQHALTDPDDAAYWHVRRELVRGHRPYLDLTGDLDPKHLRERLSRPDLPPLFRHMRIERFRAVWHVPRREGPTDQLVDFECGVSLAVAGRTIYRRACQRRRYGVVHVSPPKPFDQLTVAIADHGFLRRLGARREGRARRVFATNAVFERFDWLRRAVQAPAALPPPGDARSAATGESPAGAPGETPPERLDLTGEIEDGERPTLTFAPPFIPTRRAPAMPPAVRSVLAEMLAQRRLTDRSTDDLLARMAPDERAWEEWRIVGPHPAAQVRMTATRVPLPPARIVWPPVDSARLRREAPPADAVVFSTDAEVDLADLDYEARLRAADAGIDSTVEAAAERANALWLRWIGPAPARASGADLAGLARELGAISRVLRPALEESIRALEQAVAHAAAHTLAGFTTGSLDAYLARASRRLRAFGRHVADQRDLDAALVEYPVFNGHLAAMGTRALTIRSPRRAGKAILSVKPPGAGETAPPLVVESLRRAHPDRDLLVLDAPRIELAADRVDAAVVAGDRLVIRSSGAVLTGCLLMRRLRPLAERPIEEELRGTVVYDPSVSSGPLLERRDAADEPDGFALDHLVVTLCPRELRRAVHRTPPPGEAR